MMGMGGGRSNSARDMQQNLLMAQQSLLRGNPNMMSSRAPVNTPPNVVMGYPMAGAERSSKDSHHSPSTSMAQQVICLFSTLHVKYFISLTHGLVCTFCC
jgi:hypothetical protein